MCGIAGIHRFGAPPDDAARASDRADIGAMLRAIAYRGPDDEGIESRGRLTLGVVRLSVQDVAGGHQPLADGTGRVWAAQNGEIFNYPALRADLATRHALRTHTDTEVLPLLYLEQGAACVEALRGMFAIAVHDTGDGTTLLARDALGVKPLYWTRLGDRLLFASELKALLAVPAVPRELDLEGLGRYLALGFVPGEATVFRAVRKLRPGCRLVAGERDFAIDRWWHVPRFLPPGPVPAFHAAAAEAGRLLAEAAESQLLSDVPVGVLLSGGLDSSVLVALLPEAVRRETRTFTIGFEDGGRHDEREQARRVATHLGTHHRELQVPLDIASELPVVLGYLDEPCADPAAVPAHLVARAASAEVTVLLSGTGGDEVFGGYRRYRLAGLLRRAAWVPRAAGGVVAAVLGEHAHQRRTVLGERLVWLRKLAEARSRGSFYEAYLAAFEPAPPARWAGALMVDASPADAAAALWRDLVAEAGAVPTPDEAVAFTSDHLHYLPDDLLLKEDRTTMGASVEGRVPYLDPALVRYAAALPLSYRLGGGEGKALLRAIARRVLPEEVARRSKHGFSVPIEAWLRGPLDALLGDTLAGAGSGVFDRACLRRWHDEHRAGRDRSGPLWAALTFELWWRQVGAATPRALAEAGRARRGPRR